MNASPCHIQPPFQPTGDQPAAIEKLVSAFNAGASHQILMGVTGSGKTFTMAHVAARLGVPTLVVSHNKTLAAQLYEEFRDLFPRNAVSYFVSYYDYYQPEAYIPQRDIYIEKDAARNDDLDRLRLATTSNLIGRRDCFVVASVSCIFGLGSPEEYKKKVVSISKGSTFPRDDLLHALVDMQYERNDIEFKRGVFRVRGDVLELFPAYETTAIKVEFFGDEIESIWHIHPVSGQPLTEEQTAFIYPAKHYVVDDNTMIRAVKDIQKELDGRVTELRSAGKLLEAQRLLARTKYDMEMMLEAGFCQGIENYSRHIAGLPPGCKPFTLIDYFPRDYLLIVDESHVTIPQINAMYSGDRHRKEVLVEHGFRLPSALDNRPMRFEEFKAMWNKVLFVSATPGRYELELCSGEVIEQIIRPTGLIDPVIHVRPAQGQVADLVEQVKLRTERGQRSLVTTLTKRLAEDLSHYIGEAGVKCKYLHSEIQTFERMEILRELREGAFDCLVGVNLLREGLDLPEVSMVSIMDADKQGFLRSETSLIQMIGRCARNIDAEVYLYADKITPAMQRAMDETTRRRNIQQQWNTQNGVTPQGIKKAIRSGLDAELKARRTAREMVHSSENEYEQQELFRMLEEEMLEAANNLDFEKAAAIRDRLKEIQQQQGADGGGQSDAALAAAIDSGLTERLSNKRPSASSQSRRTRSSMRKRK